jgi:hypothetical protein
MSRNSALVLALALGSLILPARAFAQLTPARGIGRRRQFGDQRRSVRSRQSQSAL